MYYVYKERETVIKKTVFALALSLVFILCGCSETKEITIQATGDFNFTVLDIGQADAIVMQTQNHCVIIDCGEKGDGKKILNHLAENDIETVDYMFITHFDKDHVGGAAKVINNTDVKNIITPNYEGTNSEYKKYVTAANNKSITPQKITEKYTFTLDDVIFEVYPPKKSYYNEADNDFSLVIKITHGENKMLFTGDAEDERIDEFASELSGEYAFLKVPHHGRISKQTQKLIKNTKPQFAVITDSEKNPAEDEVTKILEKYGSEIYYTKNGTVLLSSDGKSLKISQK